MNAVVPLGIEHASDEACRQTDHRHVGFPAQIHAEAKACEGDQAKDHPQDSVAGFRCEQPDSGGPKHDSKGNADRESVVGHFSHWSANP